MMLKSVQEDDTYLCVCVCVCVSGIDIDSFIGGEHIQEINSPISPMNYLVESFRADNFMRRRPAKTSQWSEPKPHPIVSRSNNSHSKAFKDESHITEPSWASLVNHFQLILHPSYLLCIQNVLSYQNTSPLLRKMYPWYLDTGSIRESFILCWEDFKHSRPLFVFTSAMQWLLQYDTRKETSYASSAHSRLSPCIQICKL